ncbi:serine hydrolase [Nesterenkonia haasae]|uniref:serine hydrolase n=1 Tax=Nesterenkonia haasae TaxID=2587813 RepID=UPI001391CD2D|nr:serine hydrolase [Nesterenkonia haasae]
MHSRLPQFAGVPGRLSVAAVTAALLVSGCAPNFHAPEPSSLTPASESQDLPETVKNTADTTMRDAAAAVVQQVAEHQPTEQSPTTEEPNPEDSEDATEVGEADESADATATELEDWAEALARAHETAEQDSAEQQAEAEAEEAQRRAEADAEAEEEAQREAETDEEPEEEATEDETGDEEQPEPDVEAPQPEAEVEEPAPAPEPAPDSSNVTFDGDLDTFLTQTSSAYPGRIAISLQEVGGESRSGSTGGSDSFVTASTYKLLVGYSLIREVESGERNWDDTALGDRDLAQCFNDMLTISDNPCPEAIGPELGWANIYADAAAMGATNTGAGEGGIRTNALDLTRFMTSLATGSMSMSDSGHERMRNALAANVHRQGIPAGSAGRVLNKPGFISGNLHDTAIVHHPSGTYVLTILSQGSSWDSLAGITRDIEAALYG